MRKASHLFWIVQHIVTEAVRDQLLHTTLNVYTTQRSLYIEGLDYGTVGRSSVDFNFFFTDINMKMPHFFFLFLYMKYVSGAAILPQPDNLEVNIVEDEVTVLWKYPADAPLNSWFNVELARYVGNDDWAMLVRCTRITQTYCNLDDVIPDYRSGYKVRVQLATEDDVSDWKFKKFLLNTGKLKPPTFNLYATSSTLTVHVHQKPILKHLYPFGLTYTIYLEERGQNSKNTTAYLINDNMDKEDEGTKIFTSLHWGREYCVRIKAQTNGALPISSVSPEQCLLLPNQEWFIIAVSSLFFLGALLIIAIIVVILLCYLRHPEKTPAALKSPVSGWLPLSVGEGTMEVVTDKGWFLSSHRTELKNGINDPVTLVTVIEDGEDEDRRTSMDSGVSMESPNNGGSPPMRQEDSGCGSMGGPESSIGSETDYPLQDERTNTDSVKKQEDSGLGMNLLGQDSEVLTECVVGGEYQRQSPQTVQTHVCTDVDMFKQILPDSVLAEAVTGYRAGPQSCICSGAGQCTWCHREGHYGTEMIKQYRSVCIENGLPARKSDIQDLYRGTMTFSGYSRKAKMDTITIEDLEPTFVHLDEAFPLLTSLSPLNPVKCGQDLNMNNVSLSLCDVQLNTD
ncbi:interleukin-10 receptor subunit alpha [Parambassis ranga]|uniref:Interleukin-10 receptor subunit alpha n=1 Tax=Parambassis ranga TaxID=210632 RepID=A0A6P7JCN0_9TELE|nr:uncharacterized protein LOC114444319 [Parambassis ranga]